MNVYPYGSVGSDRREGIAGILGIDAVCTAKELSGIALLAGSPVLWATEQASFILRQDGALARSEFTKRIKVIGHRRY